MLDRYIEYVQGVVGKEGKFKTNLELAEFAGISPSQVKKYQTRETMQNVGKFLDFLGKIGGKIVFDEKQDASKDVCFVDAKIVDTVEGAESPRSEDYIAAPLVGEVGAGPGYLPGDDVKSWFLVYRQLPAIRYRKNLIAVEIGAGSNSMQPTLNPKDIVLVDRDDRDVTQPGHIMLVMDPMDGGGMIKRVSVREKDDDFIITYYSDNTAKWPPMMYSLNKDFGGDWDKSIVGRVIWAWQDMKDK